MIRNNVSVLCLHVIVTDCVLIGEIAGNKYPVLCGDGAYNTIRMEKLEES